jgi:hypothetical protein
MIRVSILILIIFTFRVAIKAQTNSKAIQKRTESTYTGTIVFNNDSIAKCEFTYNPIVSEGLIFVKTNNITSALGVTKVKSFSFYDEDLETDRNFFALHVTTTSGNLNKLFLELIYETTQISILGKNTVRVKKRNYVFIGGGTGIPVKIKKQKVYKDYVKYLLDHRNNTLHEFSQRSFLELTSNNSEVVNYMREKHFKLSEKDLDQYIELIDFYSNIERNNE